MPGGHLQLYHGSKQEADHTEPRWYAAYTCARHEKRVAEQLQLRSVEYCLPLYTAIHRWNTRQARVELPLFPGYVFVHLPLAERLRVLGIPGVAYLVGNGGRPLPLPDNDVECLRASISPSISRHAEPHPYVGPGSRVRVTAGPLAGLEGVVIRQNGGARFVISVDLVLRSIALNVEAVDVRGIEPAAASSVAA